MLIDKYMKFFETFITNYLKLVLGKKYSKVLVQPFIDKYIAVRYYNDSYYERAGIERINRELKNTAKEIVQNDDKYAEKVKLIFTQFAYFLYIDGCSKYDSLTDLLKDVKECNNLGDKEYNALKELVTNFIKERESFLEIFENKEFELKEKRAARNLREVKLLHHVSFSLYSDDAIEKAYTTGTVLENKQYLLYLMLSGKILSNTIDMNYKDNYLIEFPDTLFEKEKKINKHFKVLNNKMIKPKIHLKVYYRDYLKYKDIVHNFIKEGINIAIVLDETYDEDIKTLDLFSYVFVYEKYDYYDIILENNESINAKIISL